jgi:hypothetical protein
MEFDHSDNTGVVKYFYWSSPMCGRNFECIQYQEEEMPKHHQGKGLLSRGAVPASVRRNYSENQQPLPTKEHKIQSGGSSMNEIVGKILLFLWLAGVIFIGREVYLSVENKILAFGVILVAEGVFTAVSLAVYCLVQQPRR